MTIPFVTVVVPARNEERFIAPCLQALLRSDYPSDRMEILVVDGMSTDRTRAIVEEIARSRPQIRLVENPQRTIPAAMNLAIRLSRGEVILKMDAHSECFPSYVTQCVRYLQESGADNVGGIVRVRPGRDTLVGRVIAGVLAHPFGSGNAYVKVGASAPRWADTAAYGCYRRDVFDRIGPWNEQLAGSSDLDLNRRLRAAGGRILLVPEIVVDYRADPDLRSFWAHNVADGVWTTYVLRFGSRAWAWRHWIPLLWVAGTAALACAAAAYPPARGLLGIWAGAYLAAGVAASAGLARRMREPAALLLGPVVFLLRHLAHGLGAAWGLLLLALPGVQWRGRRTREA